MSGRPTYASVMNGLHSSDREVARLAAMGAARLHGLEDARARTLKTELGRLIGKSHPI